MPAKEESSARIRALNDQMRTAGPGAPSRNRWLLTSGVLGLGATAVEAVVARVTAFSEFTEDNDPHGEHDFGAIDGAGQRLFWKIDYYDHTLTGGSPDPADEAVTCRVLTIMLAMEY